MAACRLVAAERGVLVRDKKLIARVKSMRREPTEPEYRLWLQLRAERFQGAKFRRQKVIGPYIVDFASRGPMLVIEVDGDTHAGREMHDAVRTRYLETQGYRVIRVSNIDVMRNMDGVLQYLGEALAPLPTLSPEGERAITPPPSPLQGRGARLGERSKPSRSGEGL